MIKVRRAEDRGHANYGWLDTYHSFSFADYYDPANMGFRALRVINEDRVKPAHGFGTHPHRDMEILTYVLEGELEHRDSMGTGSVIRPGELQRMSAGSGVTHSEQNPSKSDPVHLLQIWVLPEEKGIKPSYEQRKVLDPLQNGRLKLIASGDARQESLKVHQDVDLFAARLSSGEEVAHALAPERHAWVQVARGEINVNGTPLQAGDGAAITGVKELSIVANGHGAKSEVLLFDLA